MICLKVLFELLELSLVLDDITGVIPLARCEPAKDEGSIILDVIGILLGASFKE